MAQMVKNPCAMQVTRVQSLSWEDPLKKGMATNSSIPAWRIPWTQEPGRLESMGSQRVGHAWRDVAVASLVEYGLSGPGASVAVIAEL